MQDQNSYSYDVEDENLVETYDEVSLNSPHVNIGVGLEEEFVILEHNEMNVVQKPYQETIFYYYSLQDTKDFESIIYNEYHDLDDNVDDQ